MKNIILIGTGQMARDYYLVLKSLQVNVQVVGRGEENAKAFYEQFGVMPTIGGVENYLSLTGETFDAAIIAVGVDVIKNTAEALLKFGCTNILLEKPGGVDFNEVKELALISTSYNAKIYVAYNRRFYKSVYHLKRLVEDDGGILSGNFEFTEWSHIIKDLKLSDVIKKNLFFTNSTHVLDLAFLLMGKPVEFNSFVLGDCGWHKPSIFVGSGMTDKNILFSYSANWESAGSWGIEINTSKRRLILRPMEKLFEQRLGELKACELHLEDTFSEDLFKPGLLRQVQAFLFGWDSSVLKTLDEQVKDISWMSKILTGCDDAF